MDSLFYNSILFILIFTIYIIVLLFIYECNHSICRFIKKYIIADIPFLQISDDDRFHTMDLDVNLSEKGKYRYSLFFIPFGQYKVYVFSFKDLEFSFFKIISYEYVTKKQFLSIKEKTLEKASILDKQKKSKQVEILKDEIQSYKETKNLASIKATFYITILAAITSVIFSQINNLNSIYIDCIQEDILMKFLFWYTVLLFINFILISIHFITVKGFYKESFEDFISEEINKKRLKYFYLNSKWYFFESQKSVGYIKNIEFYLVKNLIFSTVFICFYLFRSNT
ncbi:hypothetical protein ACN2EP_06360 [Aliarcobacter butzleri]|uniref:hypothetical protein n=1 Tax=Aliarcobacter butzleri TaxID=28197 RepID=UPI003AFAE3E2